MSGFKISTGADLDTLFQTRTATDPSAQYIAYTTSDGKSLSERYLPYTSGVKAITTGFRVTDASGNLQDINNYYAKPLSWSTMGTGTNALTGSTVLYIYCVHVLDMSNIYVGGAFTTIRGTAANHIARYNANTSQWFALGSGVSFASGSRPYIHAIYAFSSSQVYIGGDFDRAGGATCKFITLWNGSGFSQLGGGLDGSQGVRAIAKYDNNNIFVGGNFSTAGGQNGFAIARYTISSSTWSVSTGNMGGIVLAIYVLDASSVYVGGNFTTAGGVSCNRIAKWNPNTSAWSALGAGTNRAVYAITLLDASNIIVGGEFDTAGGVTRTYIARWNFVDSSWSTIGTIDASPPYSNGIYTINVMSSDVYLGGVFQSAGGVATNNIVRWNKTSDKWYALASGVGGGASSTNTVYSISASSTFQLYVGGYFSTPGQYLASWS